MHWLLNSFTLHASALQLTKDHKVHVYMSIFFGGYHIAGIQKKKLGYKTIRGAAMAQEAQPTNEITHDIIEK